MILLETIKSEGSDHNHDSIMFDFTNKLNLDQINDEIKDVIEEK